MNQQMLLGKVLDHQYSQTYGSNWHADFGAMNSKCPKKESSVSDKISNPESEGDDSGADNVDADYDDSYSGSNGPWSVNDKWQEIISEVGEPPPFDKSPNFSNPFP